MNCKKLEEVNNIDIATVYNLLANEKMHMNHAIRYKKIADLVNKNNDTQLLNVGCGKGFLELQIFNKEITSIDLSRKDIEKAKKNIIFYGSKNIWKYNFIVADILTFKPKKKYNIIICSEVIEHIKSDDKVLANISELLSNNGIFILTVPNINRSVNVIRRYLNLKPNYMASDHLREYTKQEIINLLHIHGFEVISYEGVYFGFPIPGILDCIINRLYTSKSTYKLMLVINNLLEKFFPLYCTYHLMVAKNQPH